MKQRRKKYKHTGTDCSHTARGMCDRCRQPLAVHPMGRRPPKQQKQDKR